MTSLAILRAPSPNPPRASISSNRSNRRSGIDFEAALNANETIYLTTTAPIGEESESSLPSPGDVDAPQPVEKMSFEDDLKRSTPVKQISTPTVVPPTPVSSSKKSERRSSQMDPQRGQPMKSLGLDEAKIPPPKRRSIFRSPGTASSPDLATLVRKAKEARAAGQTPSAASQAAEQAVQSSRNQTISPSHSPMLPSSPRNRAVSSAVPRHDDDWERFSNGDLKSIANGSQTDSPRRTRQSSGEDSFKSMRSKAKGMFGRMFGSKEPSPQRNERPPVPPIPMRYSPALQTTNSQDSSDVFGQIQSTRQNVEKTLPNSPASSPKLPPPAPKPQPTLPEPKRSSHTRQPATDTVEPATTFSEDIAGMLDGIGVSEPAKELGLPPDSLRLKAKPRRADSQRNTLGRAALAPAPSHRTSSLPSPRLEPAPQIRNASSPVLVQEKEETPSVRLVSPRPESVATIPDPIDVVTPVDDEEKGRKLACEFLENDHTHISADKVAVFLGGTRPVNAFALKYYMQYFDMKGQKVDQSFRDLCQKLHLKAESQEIDRIIEAFSARYFECNPTTIFGTAGVVHTVTAGMLMLNTDLHIAELSKHMTRADFVRNIFRAIQESVAGTSTPDLINDDSSGKFATIRPRPDPGHRSISAPVTMMNDSSTTVSSFTHSRAWELETENALKEIFASVRQDRILLPVDNRLSMISTTSGPYLGRRGTLRSPNQSNDRVHTLKRNSMRTMNSPYGMSDGRLSPTPSYATSINEGYASFTQSLGFASNLSHTVIREQDDEARSVHSHVSTSTMDEMDDDELALLGAPWAKEGILQRKQYWESAGKRSQKKDWKQFFVVIQRGDLHMFVFGEGGNSFGPMGGGNWMNNAKATGEMSLMHSMAVALPPPGYSTSRPYCFSLALPTGETSFFQAGTEDLVTEWVATCNYWAARTSRQPLSGGVSNMEYGWNRADQEDDHDRSSIRSGRSNMSKLNSYRRSAPVSEKWHINDWKPPPAATMPSPLDEENQLEALQTYVKSLRSELEQHKAVEEGMLKLYLPRSSNGTKARDNWRAKSHYIHSEIYKYETYVEALRNAISLRFKKQGEKKLERSLARSMTSLHEENEDEEDEPTTPNASRTMLK